jgi:hypothetical protein
VRYAANGIGAPSPTSASGISGVAELAPLERWIRGSWFLVTPRFAIARQEPRVGF